MRFLRLVAIQLIQPIQHAIRVYVGLIGLTVGTFLRLWLQDNIPILFILNILVILLLEHVYAFRISTSLRQLNQFQIVLVIFRQECMAIWLFPLAVDLSQ